MSDFIKEFEIIEAEVPNNKNLQVYERMKVTVGNSPLVIFGTGTTAGRAIRLCKADGIKVPCLCDSLKTGTHEPSGLLIISPEELVSVQAAATVLVAAWKYENEILKKLKEIDFPEDQIFLFRYPQRISAEEFKIKHLEGYSWAYDFFEDEASKQLIIDKVRSYILSEPIQPNTKSDIYFEEGIISPNTQDIVIDGGGSDGAYAESFIRRTGYRYRRIYVYEPDAAAYIEAEHRLAEYENIKLIPKGLWRFEDRMMLYYGGLTASTFIHSSDDYRSRISSVTTLDNQFKGKLDTELPTFIKLDVEGGEREALMGAETTIKRSKPKLAISAGRNPEDIYELAQTIYNMGCDYRFALRHHEFGYFKTVLYAY